MEREVGVGERERGEHMRHFRTTVGTQRARVGRDVEVILVRRRLSKAILIRA